MASPQSSPRDLKLSSLLQLPTPLLTLVLVYLPPRCKLGAVTHLCHSLPRLSAAAFRHDHLRLTNESLDTLSSTRPHSLALFEQVRCATLAAVQLVDNAASDSQLLRLPSPSIGSTSVPRMCSTCPFPLLLVLQLRTSPTAIQTFAHSASPLPLLHTLAVYVNVRGDQRVGRQPTDSVAVLSGWLVALPALQHLTWVGSVNVRALWFLASLPLLTLDLRSCRMTEMLAQRVQSHAAHSGATLATISGTLRRLHIPTKHAGDIDGQYVSMRLALWLQRYADELANDHGEAWEVELREAERRKSEATETVTRPKWRLQHLHYSVDALSNTLAIAPSISSLTSLHISRFPTAQALNTFFVVASPATSPHLSRLVVPVTDTQSRRADETDVSEACLDFFPAFAAQLSHLMLTDLPASARACERLCAAVLSCTRLVSLQLVSDVAVGQPIALPARIEPMPLLQRLLIHSATHRGGRGTHLQHADVVRLLDACAGLCVLSLTLPNASISLLATIARACTQVRELTIRSDDVRLFDMSDELAAAAASAHASTMAPLAHLHTLHIDYHLQAGQSCAPQPTAGLLDALSSLLCRAPIRRLCLLPHVDVVSLPFYAAFPHLVRLHLHDPSLRATLRRYCHAPDRLAQTAPPDTQRRVGRSVWRALAGRGGDASDEGEEDEKHDEQREEMWLGYAAFVDERVYVADGRALTGREAWLERVRAMADAEVDKRGKAELRRACMEAEEARKQQQKEARGSRSMKKPAADAADAFIAATGNRRKR